MGMLGGLCRGGLECDSRHGDEDVGDDDDDADAATMMRARPLV